MYNTKTKTVKVAFRWFNNGIESHEQATDSFILGTKVSGPIIHTGANLYSAEEFSL
jgi:hypothetical protein